jgi:hypothetical protein
MTLHKCETNPYSHFDVDMTLHKCETNPYSHLCEYGLVSHMRNVGFTDVASPHIKSGTENVGCLHVDGIGIDF